MKRGILARPCAFAAVLTHLLLGLAPACHATYALPADRVVQWQGNVGVSGDIPRRTTVCATLRPSGGDDSSRLQTEIKNCPEGGVLQLEAGSFVISRPVNLKSGITLRGKGMGRTVIKGSGEMALRRTGPYLVGMHDGHWRQNPVEISSGAVKGSDTIVSPSLLRWRVGDLVLIDQTNSGTEATLAITNRGNNGTCGWCGRLDSRGSVRSSGQIVRVTALPDRNSAVFQPPLYFNYGNAPQATQLLGIVNEAGLEDLTVDNSSSGNSGQVCTVRLSGTSNCWLYRVEVVGSHALMVLADGSYRDTIRGCRFHEGVPATPYTGPAYDGPSGRGNGINLVSYNSANLIEDNTLFNLSQPLLLSGATSGNVISYNYIPVLYRSDNPSWSADPINFHGAHPMMNLIEGNYTTGRLIADHVHGSSSHNTFFRNRTRLAPGVTGGAWDVELESYSHFYNLVGNVLGTPGAGHETRYELNGVDLSGDEKAIYRFGYNGDGDGSAAGNDPRVGATVLRHGNWDSVTGGALWRQGDRKLPPSLYLRNRPRWWGRLPWPCIGPELSPNYPAATPVGAGAPWDKR